MSTTIIIHAGFRAALVLLSALMCLSCVVYRVPYMAIVGTLDTNGSLIRIERPGPYWTALDNWSVYHDSMDEVTISIELTPTGEFPRSLVVVDVRSMRASGAALAEPRVSFAWRDSAGRTHRIAGRSHRFIDHGRTVVVDSGDAVEGPHWKQVVIEFDPISESLDQIVLDCRFTLVVGDERRAIRRRFVMARKIHRYVGSAIRH